MPPDPNAYAIYRQFLLETSQLPGGYYSSKGRAQLLRHVVDRMVSTNDPYDLRLQSRETAAQQLRVVR
jgi:capsular polysaccharide export protein